MFKFFTDKRWFTWSIGGTLLILFATWYQVSLDVRINEWFGEFYDTLQKALAEPGAVSEKEFIGHLIKQGKLTLPEPEPQVDDAREDTSEFVLCRSHH